MKIFKTNNLRTKNILKNIFGSLIIKGVSILISLLIVPITLGYLDKEMYGIWLTLSSITLWLNFFDIGLTLGLKNKLTEAISRNDFEKGKKLVSTSYIMMVLIFIPTGILLEILVPLVNWSKFLNVNEIFEKDIQKALFAMFAFVSIQMIVNVFTSVAAAFQKVAISNIFPVIGQIISLLIIYGLTKFVAPSFLVMVFAITSIPVVVLLFGSFFYYKTKFKVVAPSISYFEKSVVKEILGLGLRFFIIRIQLIILFQSTNILISNIAGPVAVTEYNIAFKFINLVSMVIAIITSTLWPAFTDAYSKNDLAWMKKIFKKLMLVATGTVGILFTMVLSAPFVYKVWVGNKITIPTILTIVIAIQVLLQTINSINANLINGVGKIKLQSYLAIWGMLIHIPLSFLLGKFFAFGSIGVVMSLIIIRTINLPIYFIQVKKILNNTTKGIWSK